MKPNAPKNDDSEIPLPTSLSMDCDDQTSDVNFRKFYTAGVAAAVVAGIALLLATLTSRRHQMQPFGPYKLLECQEGQEFFDFYDFYEGPDSLGSAGYNTYVGKERALQQGLVNITEDELTDDSSFIFMKSAPTASGPRESIRLEGKTRFERGLFLLDLEHMPAGCGVWPAFWLTDEANWPVNGEIVRDTSSHQIAYLYCVTLSNTALIFREGYCRRCQLSNQCQNGTPHF
jgi:hypothetical protein